MNNYNEENNNKLDKILLFLRRLSVLLFILLIIWIILSKVRKVNDVDKVTNDESALIESNLEVDSNFVDLGQNYKKDNENIYYKGEIVPLVNFNDFRVIKRSEIEGTVINSNNLLNIFANYETRVFLMKKIDNIIKNEKNVTNELKKSSENGMYQMKNEYDVLSEFDWGDRYDMTNQQRAKFAIMFLYIKIAKGQSNDRVTMSNALNELKLFLENFDKKDLEKEIKDRDITRVRGDIGVDKNCMYVNGQLYACFLDDLFVK